MSTERIAAERLVFRLVCVVLALAAVVWLLPQVWDKFSPFLIAMPIAALMQRPIHFLHGRLKLKPSLISVILVLLLLGLLFGICAWLFGILSEQVTQILSQSGNFISSTVSSIRQAANNLTTGPAANLSPEVQGIVRKAMTQMVDQVASWGTTAATGAVSLSISLVSSIPYGIIYISFFAIGLYFIANNYDDIRSYLPGGRRHRQDSNTSRLTNSAVHSLNGYLRVQLTFALMVLIGSWIYLHIFGHEYSSLIALMAAVMEMIPMVGSGLLYIVMAVIYFLGGNAVAGLEILILTGVLQLLRRILEPRLMANSIGVSPLQSLIGMFAGMRFGGIVGLIAGPVMMSVLVGAFRGQQFDQTMKDIGTVVRWFRKRWNMDPAGPAEKAGPANPVPVNSGDNPSGAKKSGTEKTES